MDSRPSYLLSSSTPHVCIVESCLVFAHNLAHHWRLGADPSTNTLASAPTVFI
jgi:hypothetical protein